MIHTWPEKPWGPEIKCLVCGHTVKPCAPNFDPTRVYPQCGEEGVVGCVGDCPGDELSALFGSFGLQVPCSGCKALMHEMNQWKAAGCEERRDAILERLAANEAKLGWGEWLAAGMNAAKAGYLSRGQVVDEAIRRARKAVTPP